ncbi:unnamed protein product [Rhizopus stolonifer]
MPMKRQYQQDNSSSNNALCSKCIPKTHIDLEKLLATSPYGSLLSQRKYISLTDEMCELMNRDWRHNSQKCEIGLKVDESLEPLLLSEKRENPLIANYVSIIRLRNLDSHSSTSIRLDQKLLPSVGGITTNFNLTVNGSFASKIFVNVESATAAKTIISKPATTCVSNTGMLSHQLRQIRTQFDLHNTYALVRASGPLTKNHTCHPYTIFTLIDCDRGRNPCTALFDTIGNEILKNGAKANLMKSVVLSCNENATGKIKEVLKNILTLYNMMTICLSYSTLLSTSSWKSLQNFLYLQ